MDCRWSSWGSWTKCSEKCGGGTKLKTRSISQPAQNGGTSCVGTSSKEISCNTYSCPKPSKGNHSYFLHTQYLIMLMTILFSVDCKWSQWGQWGSCSEKCGGGTQRQTRFISQPALNGGKKCEGSSWNEQACNPDPCPRITKGA